MSAVDVCLAILEPAEGFSNRPYPDCLGVWTIGYGSTFNDDGSHVGCLTPPINKQQAEARLRTTLGVLEASVRHMAAPAVLNDNQAGALMDFAYNLGEGALKGSTLLRNVRSKNFKGAAGHFAEWCHGGGKVLPGLVKRRAAEAALFVKVV